MSPSLLDLAECLLGSVSWEVGGHWAGALKEAGWGWIPESLECPGEEVMLHPETSGAVRVLKQQVGCSNLSMSGASGSRLQGQGLLSLSLRRLTMPKKGSGHGA